jgi:hypothetical protein
LLKPAYLFPKIIIIINDFHTPEEDSEKYSDDSEEEILDQPRVIRKLKKMLAENIHDDFYNSNKQHNFGEDNNF